MQRPQGIDLKVENKKKKPARENIFSSVKTLASVRTTVSIVVSAQAITTNMTHSLK